MQNYCPYCGQIHPADFKFCPSTGKALKDNLCDVSAQDLEFQSKAVDLIPNNSRLEFLVMPPSIPDSFKIKLKNQDIKMILSQKTKL